MKKKEVSIIRMYIAPTISNLAICDQGNGRIKIDIKLIKREHTLFSKFCNCAPFEHV